MATIVCNEEETRTEGPCSRQDRAAFDSDTGECPTAEECPGMIEELARLRDELAVLREDRNKLREDCRKGVEGLARLRKELELQKQAHPKEKLSDTLAGSGKEIIGDSAALRAVLKKVETVAPTNSSVLIHGETGTGKELIALALHRLSQRSARPLSKINCAAIPAALLESELFGHEKGAFTGAYARKIGRFEMADQGTLFLDEVADIPLEVQPKLLRVLQEKEFERVGGLQSHRVNVRLVAATSRDLSRMVADQQFRNDLYYRLNVFPIRVPSLRERADDIPALVQHFVDRYACQMNKRIESIPSHVMDSLKNYCWPGNIRELQNVIERAVIVTSDKTLTVPLNELDQTSHGTTATGAAVATTLEECERAHILHVLNETGWVIGGPHGGAKRLGLKRTTLISKMKKLGLARKKLPIEGS